MKPFLNTLLLAPVLALIATTAYGQVPVPDAPGATSKVAPASQYILRSFQQSWAQREFDDAHPSGFSLGSMATGFSSKLSDGAAPEVDLYGGYSGSVSDIGYSAIVYYYIFPGSKISAANVKYDYGELALGVNYKIFSARYNHTYTRDFLGLSDARGTGYVDLGANIDIGSGYELQLHYGMGRVRNWPDYDWRDYKIALTRKFSNGWIATGAVTKGNASSGLYDHYPTSTLNASGAAESTQPLKTNAVISVTKSF